MRVHLKYWWLRVASVATAAASLVLPWAFGPLTTEPASRSTADLFVVAVVQVATTVVLVSAVWGRRPRVERWVRIVLTIWYHIGASVAAAVAGSLAHDGYPPLVALGIAVGAITLALTGDWCLSAWADRPSARTEIAAFLISTHVLALLVLVGLTGVGIPGTFVTADLVGDGFLALTWLALPVCAGMAVRLLLAGRNNPQEDAQPSMVGSGAPPLTGLTPMYSSEHHGLYLRALRAALTDSPTIRNIALAGPYGTGKSSILSKLSSEFPERVLQVSLLTLGAKGAPNGHAESISNRIQKEVVKQLLYQRRPTNAPQSRFRRIVRFSWPQELSAAAIVAAAVVIVASVAGLEVSADPGFQVKLADPLAANIAFYLLLAAGAGGLLIVARALSRGRFGIDKVTAGPATITLPPRSDSYFDEYLDEIIYLFESDPQRDIVIIEDLDRFDDHTIYEALRSLNGILNAAQQLDGRHVRFIYAVRDSVFEDLGDTGSAPAMETDRVRSDRTKFFDLIIPVVPFITHKNARDLMRRELTTRGYKVSEALVDLAARYVADMRLIRNVVNEYGIFRDRLIDASTRVPGLDEDRLFAMMLFKNLHIREFEQIREAESALDDLWEVSREFIGENISRLRAEVSEARDQLAQAPAAIQYAKNLAAAIQERVDALVNAPGSAFSSSTLQMRRRAVERPELETPEFWAEFIAESETLNVPVQVGYTSQLMQLSRTTIEVLTGMSLDMEKFQASAAAGLEEAIAARSQAIRDLSRANWVDLAKSAYRHAMPGSTRSLTFAEICARLLPSSLATDLVINGYITPYFSLHVSAFYGTAIGPTAMTYILKYVDLRRADVNFELSGADVDAIIREQGITVLSERSMFNISVLDHLLAERAADADKLVASIVAAGADGTEFISRYLEGGARRSEAVATIARRLAETLNLIVESSSVSDAEKVELIDTAIAAASPEVTLAIPEGLADLVEARPDGLRSLSGSGSAEAAVQVVRFISRAEIVLQDLECVSVDALQALRSTRAYAINRRNLEVLTGSDDISLEKLHATDPQIFDNAAARPRAYVTALGESSTTPLSVHSSDLLISFLKGAGGTDVGAIEEVIRRSAPECRVLRLDEVPQAAWKSLLEAGMVPLTLGNVQTYVDNVGHVDDTLGSALAEAGQITTAEDSLADRATVARAVLNAPTENLSHPNRVQIAKSVSPEMLSGADIEPRSGGLVGALLKEGLVADDAEAFSPRLMVDYETQALAILGSAAFVDFAGPATLSPAFLASFFEDDRMEGLYPAVAATLDSYTPVSREVWTAFAQRALEPGPPLTPTASQIRDSARAGIEQVLVIRVLAAFRGLLSSDELRMVLRAVGEPWSGIADPGYATRDVTITPEARSVLRVLQTSGVVSKFVEKEGKFHVTLRRK